MLTIDITRALAIDGWMSEQELVWLAERASEHKLIVEVGSYLGRSTRSLLDNTTGIVYAFDDWQGPRDAYIEDRKQIFPQFCKNMDSYLNTDKLHLIIADYAQAYGHCPLHPDMVFIDGSHEYEDVKRDIEYWKTKLIPGGLICGHDINWETVSNAVYEVLGDVHAIPDGTIWYKTI